MMEVDNNNGPIVKLTDEGTAAMDDDSSIGIVNLKPTMLGSRRKQSKPIRVEYESPRAAELPAPAPPPAPESGYDCSSCEASYGQYEDLAWHQYETHGLLTKYGPHEPRQTSQPSDDQRHDQREAGEVLKKQSGIFHIDAYCDRCDREFCNKYFLKTHLANKHGIFDDWVPSPMSGSSPRQREPSPPPAAGSPSAAPPDARASPAPPPSAPSLPVPSLTSQYQQLADYTKLTPDFHLLAPPRTDDKKRSIEDFCELCQKHFCNKYYLRKHKMDVHGIHSDPYSVRRRLGLGTDRPEQVPPFTSPSMLPQHSAPMMLMNPFSPMMSLPPDPMLFPRYPMPPMMSLNLPPGKGPDKEKKEEHTETSDRREDKPLFSHTHFIDELISKYDRNVDRRERHHGSSDESRSEGDAKSPPKVSPNTEPAYHDKMNESERQERKPDHPRTCEVCLKVFADKYSLRMHKMNIHDIPKSKDSEKTPASIKTESLSMVADLRYPPLPLPNSLASFSSTNTVTSSPDIDVMASMYGSMAAAKLADRVTCDICNKDVCNKYFLKTHKVKMHGIDPSTLLDTPKEGSPDKEEAPAGLAPGITPIPGLALPSTHDIAEAEAARREELLKLGIDPESYCEICRKEFCSKYFLRTHKLNMHGIPTDKPGNRKEDREISRREIMERERLMQLGQLPMGVNPLFISHMEMREKGLMYPFLPSSPMKPTMKCFDEESLDSNKSEKSSKSKDPANSIRVKCELCNKELCNKYFLRTHKMKKHGIVDDVLSEGQQRKLLEMQRQGLFPVVSYNGFPKKENETSESPGPHGGESASVCQICQDSFSTPDQLHIHMFLTHGNMERGTVCTVCGLLCKDQLGLQLHMVQEHDVAIHITPEGSPKEGAHSSPERDLPMETNSLMGTFLSGSVDRESRDKDLSLSVKKMYKCSHCLFKTRAFNHLRAHQKAKHGQAGRPARRFRCRYCRKRFANRFAVRVHARRCLRPGGASKNEQLDHLDQSDSSQFIMQKFSIADSAESNFANAFVYLPVAEKVKEPITVSLHLTPTER